LDYADEHKRSAGDDHIRMQKLLEWFGDRAADSITPREVEVNFQTEEWAPATWNRYRALLSLAYRLAIRACKVKENPARLVHHKTENNGRVRFLSQQEEANLRKVIREKFPEHEPELDLSIHTGLRSGEQYGTRWKDVDFEQRVLTIPLDKGGKTSHVPLGGAALQVLLDLHQQHGGTEFVCGGARSPRYWFEAAVEAAKIENFTWHCLRHTFASRLVMSGADLRTVAELLRDKTLAMVMRYSHLAPDYKLAAVERMATVFQSSKTDTKLTPILEERRHESALVQ
jgi:integrase